ARGLCFVKEIERLLDVVGQAVEIAALEPAFDARGIDFDAEECGPVHGRRERLSATHPAEARGDDQPPRERTAEMPPGARRERFLLPLKNPLRADVDPTAGGHLAVHRQAHLFEPAKLLPRRPFRHEQAVGDQDARRQLVRLQHADRLARLHEQRLVVLQLAKRGDDAVERLPRSCRLARAAVDDEMIRILGDLGIEVVHEHAQGGFLDPALAGALGTARGTDDMRWPGAYGCGSHTAPIDICFRNPGTSPPAILRRDSRNSYSAWALMSLQAPEQGRLQGC